MAFNKKQVLEDNIEAIREALQGNASSYDKEKLSKYKGFGGIKSVLLDPKQPDLFPESDKNLIPLVEQLHAVLRENSRDENEYKNYFNSLRRSVLTSFYTPKEIVNTINEVFEENGIEFRELLDPSAGSGVFLDVKAESKTAFEKDYLTGKILKGLNPNTEVHIDAFENIPRRYEGQFDIVTSNIPFGDIPVFDPLYFRSKDKVKSKSCGQIHNYFFLKSHDMLREGGLTAFITSTGTMDSPTHQKFRESLMKNHHLVTAIRLPENLFEASGTEAQSDLIILQKDSSKNTISEREKSFIKSEKGKSGINVNEYHADFKRIIHTEVRQDTNMYGQPDWRFVYKGTIGELSAELKNYLNTDLRAYLNQDLYKQFSSPDVEQEKTHDLFSQGVSESGQFSLFDDFVIASKKKKIEPKTVKQQEQPKTPIELTPQPITKPKEELPLITFEYVDKPHYVEGSFVLSEDLRQSHIGIIEKDSEGLSKMAKEIRFLPEDFEKMKQYILVRDAYYNLDRTEARVGREIPELRSILNEEYDKLLILGGINENIEIFDRDKSFKELSTLELFEDGMWRKADIFHEPIAFKREEEHTIEEAYFKCLSRYNEINIDYISSLSKSNRDIVIETLKGQIFYNPIIDKYEPANIFLSGNVIDKYEKISLISYGREEENISESLQALKEVFPTKIPYNEIGLNLGERWIPDMYYERFATEFFGEPIAVRYNAGLDEYNVTKTSYKVDLRFQIRAANRRTYRGSDLLMFALKDNMPTLTKTIVKDGNEIKVPDSESIQKMHLAIENIKTNFQSWLEKLPDNYKKNLESVYNNKFNCFVKTQFDGSFQEFPGLNLKNLGFDEVRKAQSDAVMMIKTNNGGVVDHAVGNGKSLVMCLATQEMKRLGVANKPVILCLKANVGAIADTYKAAYPNAKILSSTDEDMSSDQRQAFYAKIKNNNWDCIIMTHDQFGKIPQSVRIQERIINEEIEKLREAKDLLSFGLDAEERRRAEKRLIKKEESLEIKLKNLQYTLAGKKDNILDFETMGIDHIMVDESHKFKNLAFVTGHNRVAGLGNSDGSQRAFNLLIAIRTIQDRTQKDLGATFLSGTTLSNSLTELYNIFNYLRPQALEQQGLTSFDAWAATYTQKSKEFEFNVVNEIVQKERFRYFVKVPELAMFYSEITDYKTAEDAGIDKPDKNEVLISLEQTSDQKEMFGRLREFAKTADGELIFRDKLSESEENAKMLIATNTAKKASLDMRLVDSGMFGDHDRNKTSICTEKVHEYYQKYDHVKGTQFIFCDLGTYKNKRDFNVYSDIKAKLIEKGIPEKEIAFVHNFNSDKQKEKMTEKMNSGEIRVLLGSTERLGTGVNAQKRVVAMHHLDIPWKPSDLEQRNGRGERQGNWVAKQHCGNQVDTFIYATKNSLDNYKFNLLKNKATFISQIKSQNISVRKIDEGALDEHNGMNFSEYIAVLSGNTDFLEKSKIEKNISLLEGEETIFKKENNRIENLIGELGHKIETSEQTYAKLQEDLAKYNAIPKDENGVPVYKINVGGIELADMKKAGELLNKMVNEKDFNTIDYKKIGSFYGFDLLKHVEKHYVIETDETFYKNKLFLGKADGLKYSFNNGNLASTPELAGEYPLKALTKIDPLLYQTEREIVRYKDQLTSLPKREVEWPKANELHLLRDKLKDLNQKIEKTISQEGGVSFAQEPQVGYHTKNNLSIT